MVTFTIHKRQPITLLGIRYSVTNSCVSATTSTLSGRNSGTDLLDSASKQQLAYILSVRGRFVPKMAELMRVGLEDRREKTFSRLRNRPRVRIRANPEHIIRQCGRSAGRKSFSRRREVIRSG